MEVDVRTTPRSYDESRSLYERSVAESNESRIISIGLDTAIENLRGMIADHRLELRDALEAVEYVSKLAIIKGMKNATKDSFTDYNRVLSTAMFVRERLLAPFVYSLRGPEAVEARSRLSDGSVGTSTELISQYLDGMDTLLKRGYEDQTRQARGVIQELTTAALLNFDQTSSRLCVPSSTYDDITRGTDLYEYYHDTNLGSSFRHAISVKTTVNQKIEEQLKNPDLIVVAAEEFGNLDLSVSRLLVRYSHGNPHLTPEETAHLRMAKNTVVNIVKRQTTTLDVAELDPIYDETLAAELVAA